MKNLSVENVKSICGNQFYKNIFRDAFLPRNVSASGHCGLTYLSCCNPDYLYHMPVRKEIAEKDGVYFITFTCTNWLPLFLLCNGYDIVYKWFNYLKSTGHYLIGYVIMPNHVHALIAFRNNGKSINTIVANGKRFMAYDLVKRLEKGKKKLVLDELQKGLNNTERKEGKKYGVFEPSFDWKECRTVKFIEQKLDYMHWNPCKENKLAAIPEAYVHSSAKFYILHQRGIYAVTSFMELEDIDLTGSVR